MGKLTISMAMFNSYVKLPEGTSLTGKIRICLQVQSLRAAEAAAAQKVQELQQLLDEAGLDDDRPDAALFGFQSLPLTSRLQWAFPWFSLFFYFL